MADILNTSMSGLLAFQRALGTTSHNIANVNTEGYNRQRVNLTALAPENIGSNLIGRGVQVADISRTFSQFQVDAVREGVTEQNRLQAYSDLANNLDSLLANADSGLAPALQALYTGLQTVADDPSSTTARQALLSQAGVLTNRLNTLQSRLESQSESINRRVDGALQQANALADSIASLNKSIVEISGAAGGAPPNDLLDQRDLALRELSQLIGVEVVPQDDGMVNIFVGSGQALVLGTESNALVQTNGPFGGTTTDLELQSISGSVVITNSVTGGDIGGLLDAKRGLIEPTQNTLGRLAIGLATAINTTHRQGMDLNGNLGGDFFSLGEPQVDNHRDNAGTGSLSVTVDSVSSLTNSSYQLKQVAGEAQLFRWDTGEQVPLTGTGTAADPFLAEGIAIELAGTLNDGDSFLVRPTADAAREIGLAITRPTELAAALPVTYNAALGNRGTASAADLRVTDPTNPALLTEVNIEFLDADTYQVNGGGSFAYTPGEPITGNGWSVVINGTPAAADSFVISSNTGGVGDNRNALNLATSFDAGVLDGGSRSVSDDYSSLIARISTTTAQADINLVAQSAITEQLEAEQQATSGVNLDEEAANMLRYQQAYQAAAQMIGVADSLFQTLIGAVRR